MVARSGSVKGSALGRRRIHFGGISPLVHSERIGFESTWLFRSGLLLGVLRYADYFDLSDRDLSATKYVLFAILLIILSAIAIRSRSWHWGWNAPTILLGFTFFACVPLLIQLAQGTAPDS